MLRGLLLLYGLTAALSLCSLLLHGAETQTAETITHLIESDPYIIQSHEIAKHQNPICWVDARNKEQFQKGHIPGATLISLSNFDEGLENLLMAWDGAATIIVYCSATSCDNSKDCVQQLRDALGTEEVYYIEGGWKTIIRLGLAKETP